MPSTWEPIYLKHLLFVFVFICVFGHQKHGVQLVKDRGDIEYTNCSPVIGALFLAAEMK